MRPDLFSPQQINDLLVQLETLQARDYESKVQTIISRLNLTDLLNQKLNSLS